jgi:hypothetical protein
MCRKSGIRAEDNCILPEMVLLVTEILFKYLLADAMKSAYVGSHAQCCRHTFKCALPNGCRRARINRCRRISTVACLQNEGDQDRENAQSDTVKALARLLGREDEEEKSTGTTAGNCFGCFTSPLGVFKLMECVLGVHFLQQRRQEQEYRSRKSRCNGGQHRLQIRATHRAGLTMMLRWV